MKNTSNKIISCILIYSCFLIGCMKNESFLKTGPGFSSQYEANVTDPINANLNNKLDVVIPVFNPGLLDDGKNEENGIWPELRRAEANRFAYKLKQSLDETKMFKTVRVVPNKTVSGDLYILGKIKESNGMEVEIELTVLDISGKEWMNDSFEHEVSESFYKNYRSKGQDPYDPVFKKAADEIVSLLKKRDNSELEDLKSIANVRFGASFNEASFLEYIDTDGKYIKLIGKPSDNDPMLQRVLAVREKEMLFIDNIQTSYASFSQNMENSYINWQEASFTERKLHKEAKKKSLNKAIGGAVLFGLSIFSATKSNNNDFFGKIAPTITALGGTWSFAGFFKSKEEAMLHKDAIDEIGQSINIGLAPQVLSHEEETIKLTGDIQEQFSTWRAFLNRIYKQESVPDVEL